MHATQSIAQEEKQSGGLLRAVYVSSFLFAFHAALLAYIESSFLGTFLNDTLVGTVFALGSVASIVGLIAMPSLLNRYGNYRIIFSLILVEIISLAILASMKNPVWFLVPVFIVHLSIFPIALFSMDIFLESNTKNETTGKIRGVYLTAQNAAWLAPPLIAGLILTDGDYWKIFASAGVILFPVLVIIFEKFNDFRDPPYAHIPLIGTLREIWTRKDIYRIFMSNLLLSFFFSWMVIYTPLYLHKYMGMAWGDIGIIFTIMLVPFVLFGIPSGSLSDTRFGEKEMLSLGFLLMAITTGLLTFVTSKSVLLWAALLFMTRIGATLVQTMNESYFFKQINASDAAIISVFRYTHPLGYLLGPLAASALLAFIDFRFMFLILGIIVLYGLRYSLTIKDTK
ncbi:MAG: MFS transporter [Candidatus Lloydbacteria bacterium]|nr:MFS transporter [Candidatus Lloydbacteria bacterium]